MIVALFIALFLFVAVGSFVRSGFVNRPVPPHRQYACEGQPTRYVPAADNP